MSRRFVVGLLESSEIRSRKAGAHRRMRLKDVLAYRRRRNASRHAGLGRLTVEAQDLGIYED